MAYRQTINQHLKGSAQDRQQLIRELDTVKADLVAIRAAMAALLAKLDLDATVTDTNYAATCAPAASTFLA